jgi:hypothetical protein
MNDELERIWLDAVVASLRHNLGICLEGLRKPMKPLSRDNWCPGLNSKGAPPQYTYRALPLDQSIRFEGHATSQVVSRRIPTGNPDSILVPVMVFAVYKVALEQVFSEYFSFPCQFSFHQLLHIN